MGCSEKVSFQLFSALNWVSHGTQNFRQWRDISAL